MVYHAGHIAPTPRRGGPLLSRYHARVVRHGRECPAQAATCFKKLFLFINKIESGATPLGASTAAVAINNATKLERIYDTMLISQQAGVDAWPPETNGNTLLFYRFPPIFHKINLALFILELQTQYIDKLSPSTEVQLQRAVNMQPLYHINHTYFHDQRKHRSSPS